MTLRELLIINRSYRRFYQEGEKGDRQIPAPSSFRDWRFILGRHFPLTIMPFSIMIAPYKEV
ncbi:MAG: hypothetical protein QG657_705 [Acidobacteriota bacterium]|nr:hypothetical protein [Acidobacteriota bacterium]